MLSVWLIINVFILLLGAVILDLKTGRIPNCYNGIWFIYGVVLSVISGGLKGLVVGAAGGLIPVIGLMVLFAFRVLGAGDIKLFAVVGTFVGLDVIWIVIYSFLLCGLYGGALVIARLARGVISGDVRLGIVRLATNNGKCTIVAFSVFILGGFILYLWKGGYLFGI